MFNNFEEGQLIKTKIVAIYGENIFLDLNMKSEGIIDSSEFLNDNGTLSVKVGDTISAYFISNDHGEMHFTTRLKGDKANTAVLEKAYQGKIPVEGSVEKEIKGGFEIKIGDSRAFCPFSQMGYRQKEEPKFFIGKTMTFLIQEFNREQHNIIVSNRAFHEEEENKKVAKLKKELKVGMLIKGTILSLQSFGAFVDVEGIQALLPISEIKRSRVQDIEKELKIGEEIQAQILSLDLDHKKMSISTKALIEDPWDTVLKKYKVGDKIEGTISKITSFGLFINIEPGMDGLVFISKLPETSENTNLNKLYKIGEKMFVEIDNIDEKGRRIALSPTKSKEEEDNINSYMQTQVDDKDDTYNPFAEFMKNKK
ncbi:MAG: S1 RNA-binding domain-containing protein [Sphaerochaetaceae bacterium]|nr:S1 RNA-binding domain-containing protein [Sphaerochaetaceae bacterium]